MLITLATHGIWVITSQGLGTLKFPYICRLRPFLGVQINIFGVFQKKIYFLGYIDFVDIYWDITKMDWF